jgi:hypothetical protein
MYDNKFYKLWQNIIFKKTVNQLLKQLFFSKRIKRFDIDMTIDIHMKFILTNIHIYNREIVFY